MIKMKSMVAAVVVAAGVLGFNVAAQTSGVKQTNGESVKKELNKETRKARKNFEKCPDIAVCPAQKSEACPLDGKRRGGKFNPLAGLELTEAQTAEINKVRENMRKEMKDNYRKSEKECEKIRADYDKKVEKILTPAQFAQYKENMKNAKGDRGKFNGKHPFRKDKKAFAHGRKHNKGMKPQRRAGNINPESK